MILWPEVSETGIYETDYSFRFCRETSRRLTGEDLFMVGREARIENVLAKVGPNLGDALLVVNDPELVVPAEAFESMRRVLRDTGAAIVGPVFNETAEKSQAATLPFPYVDVTTFVETAAHVRDDRGDVSREADVLDSSCFMVSPSVFGKVSGRDSWGNLLGRLDGTRRISDGALVHRFGNYYGAERPDLVELVPPEARKILDVGCARGGYGRLLKRSRPEVVVVGVELNEVMAREAGAIYDRVISQPLEDAELESDFDCVNLGDVLEHLRDPWTMLRKIHAHLRPGGSIVGSTPNAGHWSIVRGLTEGRFSYVPVGLLCVTHIRFFTESSLRELLEGAGFVLDSLHRDSIEPTPAGWEFIRTAAGAGLGDEGLLRTNEFVFRAKKA